MKNYQYLFKEKINQLIQNLKIKEYRFKVLFITSFLFIFCFLSLSYSNPYYFLNPLKIYPIFLSKKKKYYYYSYDRETKELKELTIDLLESSNSNIENMIFKLAKLVQEPIPFLRGIRSSIETIYFPAYSFGIINVIQDKQKLYIIYDQDIVNKYSYQRETNSNQDFDFFSNYQKALIQTIFKNYPEIIEIHWIDKEKENIFNKSS